MKKSASLKGGSKKTTFSLDNFNMPLQMNYHQPQYVLDFPLQQQNGNFICKKIEKDICVTVTGSGLEDQEDSVILNLLSGQVKLNTKRLESTKHNTISSSTPKLNSYESIAFEKTQVQPFSVKANVKTQEFRRKKQNNLEFKAINTQNSSPSKQKNDILSPQKSQKSVTKQINNQINGKKTNLFDYMKKTEQEVVNLPQKTIDHFVRKRKIVNTNHEMMNQKHLKHFASQKQITDLPLQRSNRSKSKNQVAAKDSLKETQSIKQAYFENQILLSKQKKIQIPYQISNHKSSMEGGQTFDSQGTSNNTEERIMLSQMNLQSIFSPSQKSKFRRKTKRQSNTKLTNKKPKVDQQIQEDKENMQVLSNQKVNNQHKRKASLGSTQKLTLNQEIVQQLRDEVNRQIKRSQEHKSESRQKDGERGTSNSKKHFASMIPYDTRVKLRSKLRKNPDELQLEIEQQQKEYQDMKKMRLRLKQKREDERLEQQQWIQMVKQSLSESPKKSQYKKQEQVTKNPKINVEFIENESVSNQESNQQQKRKIILSQKASTNESQSQDSLSHYIMRVANSDQNNQQNIKTKISPIKNSLKFKNYLQEIKLYKQNESASKNQDLDVNENKAQNIENFVKEKKQKDKLKLRLKQDQEDENLWKIQRQLQSLQKNYYIGLQEYKTKQRGQSEKRSTQNKNLSKKRKAKSRQTSKSNQKFKLDYERNSMPNVVTSPPKLRDGTTKKARAEFQSPLQALPNGVHEGGVQTEGGMSQESHSPFKQGSSSQSNYDTFSQKFQSRGSIGSTQTFQNIASQKQWPPLQIKESKGQGQMLYLQQQFNKKSSVPLLLPSQQRMDSILTKNNKGPIFANESVKDMKSSTNTDTTTGAKIHQKKTTAEIKKDQLFEEFTKMRKELEKNMKEQKLKSAQEKLNIKLKSQKSNRKNSSNNAKKNKNKNLPFRAPIIFKNDNEGITLKQTTFSKFEDGEGLINVAIPSQNNQQDENIKDAKKRIIYKLQEVADKMQTYFKQQKPQQVQQTILISGNSNIILEEESKEDDMTHQSPSFQKQMSGVKINPQLIGDEVSQIRRLDEESLEQEGGLMNKNENTTFLLKKMYSEGERALSSKSEMRELASTSIEQYNAAIVIQKNFRGYICRRILSQKLRIDNEFRILRQKYEVKSNLSQSNYSQGLLSSLALSKSNMNNNKRLSNQQIKQEPLNKNLAQSQKNFSNIQQKIKESPELISQRPSEYKYQDSIQSSQPQSDKIFKRASNQFYTKNSNEDDATRQIGSVFKSITIQGSNETNQQTKQQNEKIFDYQPKQLFYDNPAQEVEQQQLLFSNNSALNGQNQIKEQLKQNLPSSQSQEEEKEEKQLETKSQRSQDPFNEDSPYFKEIKQQRINDLKNDYKSLNPQAVEQLKSNEIQEFDPQYHQQYSDSPLMMQDLEIEESSQQKSSHQNKTPLSHHTQKRSEQVSQQKVITEKMSPIVSQSPPSQQLLFQQKMSFDVSSLINYDEDKNPNSQNLRQAKQEQSLEQNSEIEIDIQMESQLSITGNQKKYNEQKEQKLKNFQGSPINSSSNNTSLFDKNSFQHFAQSKIKKAFKAEAQIENWIEDLNSALQQNIIIKQKQLQQECLSVRAFNRKKLELERWVEKEKREIKMTQRYFVQGRLKLSQLLDNFVQDQGRMKDAVKQIKKDQIHGHQVRKSHSFDGELNKQHLDSSNHNLFGSQQNISEEYNTISGGRRFSSGLHSQAQNNNISLADDFSQHSKQIKEQALAFQVLKEESEIEDKRKSGKTFEYLKDSIFEPKPQKEERSMNQGSFEILSQDNVKINTEDDYIEKYLHQDVKPTPLLKVNESEEEKDESIIVLKNNLNEKVQQKSKRLSIGDDLQNSDSKMDLIVSAYSVPDLKESSGGDENNLLLSDTPLGGGKEIKFPEGVKELENLEMQEEQRVSEIVDDIVNHILLREVREKLFPQRALSKITKLKLLKASAQSPKNSNEVDTSKSSPKSQILVLDNNDESTQQQTSQLSPLSEQSPVQMSSQEKEQEEQELQKQGKYKGIETNILHVNGYIQEIFTKIKTDKEVLNYVLDNVSQPLYKDPLLILSHLQNSLPQEASNPPGNSSNSEEEKKNDEENLDLENPMPFQQSVLSVDLYLDIEKERRGGLSISQMKDSFQDENSQSFVAEMENIHNKAIFDAVNEALDGFRPYGLRGPPLPWSKQSKTLTFKFGKEETVDYLLQKVKFKVLEWSHINAGLLGPKTGLTYREKEQLELMREERLARILIQEAEENEGLWTDYEYEETQTKLDLADIILNELCFETVNILAEIKANQKATNSQEDQSQNESQQKI